MKGGGGGGQVDVVIWAILVKSGDTKRGRAAHPPSVPRKKTGQRDLAAFSWRKRWGLQGKRGRHEPTMNSGGRKGGCVESDTIDR